MFCYYNYNITTVFYSGDIIIYNITGDIIACGVDAGDIVAIAANIWGLLWCAGFSVVEYVV